MFKMINFFFIYHQLYLLKLHDRITITNRNLNYFKNSKFNFLVYFIETFK